MSATLLGMLETDVGHSCALAVAFGVQCEGSGSKPVITLKGDKSFDAGRVLGEHTPTRGRREKSSLSGMNPEAQVMGGFSDR